MLQNWNFLLAEIWVLLAAASLLTLIVTWFMWGRAVARASIHKLKQTEEELTSSRTMLHQTRAELQRAKGKQEALKERLAREQNKFKDALENAQAKAVTQAEAVDMPMGERMSSLASGWSKSLRTKFFK